MSNKNLLNESQIRQFMKLAKLEPLTPGFVHGLTERGGRAGDEDDEPGEKGRKDYTAKKEKPGEDIRKGAEKRGAEGTLSKTGKGVDYVKETHGRGTTDPGYGQDATSPGRRVKISEVEADPEALEDYAAGDEERGEPGEAAEDELDAAGEEGGEEEVDLEGGGGGRMVSVNDFLAALESTLEEFLDDEVEIDTDEMGAGEEEVEVSGEEGDLGVSDDEGDLEVDAELELQEGDEEELEEILGFGKSGADKAREKRALGKKGSYAPDPEAGEKSSAPTPEEIAAAKKEPRTRRPRRSAGDIAGGLGGSWKGIAEGDADKLVEQITKRVAARILKSALHKK